MPSLPGFSLLPPPTFSPIYELALEGAVLDPCRVAVAVKGDPFSPPRSSFWPGQTHTHAITAKIGRWDTCWRLGAAQGKGELSRGLRGARGSTQKRRHSWISKDEQEIPILTRERKGTSVRKAWSLRDTTQVKEGGSGGWSAMCPARGSVESWAMNEPERGIWARSGGLWT